MAIRKAAEKHLGQLKDGDSGDAVCQSLRRYMRALLSRVELLLQRHSPWFSLHISRRARILHQRDLTLSRVWEDGEDGCFRELQAIKWRYHRLSLAILKYSAVDESDMALNDDGLMAPSKATDDDSESVRCCVALFGVYEHAFYALRRAEKGGRWAWTDQHDLRYDVALETELQKLITIFEQRSRSSNLLAGFGSWAQTRVGYWFPTQAGYRNVHFERGEYDDGSSAPPREGNWIFGAVPNLRGYRPSEPWHPDGNPAPPWLLQWIDLDVLWPRLSLMCGAMEATMELVNRRGRYGPEDMLCSFGALARRQQEACEMDTRRWTSIVAYGYSIWKDVQLIEDTEILPMFLKLKQHLTGRREDDSDIKRFRSAMRALTWSNTRTKGIDILRAWPSCPILPLNSGRWLVDWTVMVDTMLDEVGSLGAIFGTLATLRGREFEELVCNYLQAEATDRGYHVVWRGHGAEKRLQFESGGPSRDADIAIQVNDVLILIEVKAHYQPRDVVVVGRAVDLGDRWSMLVKELAEVDSLAQRLAAEPDAKNFCIPGNVRWILPVLCTSATEWVPSLDPRWWLYDDLPRICNLTELRGLPQKLAALGLPMENALPVRR